MEKRARNRPRASEEEREISSLPQNMCPTCSLCLPAVGQGMRFTVTPASKVGQGNGASIERGKSLEILVT